MTRSVTLTSSMNKIVQLPDIVPTPTTQPVTLIEPKMNENHVCSYRKIFFEFIYKNF